MIEFLSIEFFVRDGKALCTGELITDYFCAGSATRHVSIYVGFLCT